ncbi:chitin elicitor receptor kinase 1 [Euphorbia peplus]|nr:chitin elicitor receptor kinase 1 [Euphorbia peplus]
MNAQAEAKCKSGCALAFASYSILEGVNFTYISTLFSQKDSSQILLFNPSILNEDAIVAGTRINIPFSCDCLNAEFLGHTFTYTVQSSDTYPRIGNIVFANLTTEDWIQRVNIYDHTRIPQNAVINVTVNCSCGDKTVSNLYGLFTTYPLRPRDNLSSLAMDSGVPPDLLQKYNPALDFSAGCGIAYVPARGWSFFSLKYIYSIQL